MSTGAVIGALRGVLVLDTSNWTPAVSSARGDLAGLRGACDTLSRSLQDLGEQARAVGVGLTAGVSVPLGLMAASSVKTASNFQASMKRVEAALDGVDGKQLKALSDQARELGPRVGKGAAEAADGIESLGLAGLDASQILGGGLKATLDLAAAGAVNLAPAAGLVTDVMGQFKITASQLPFVVRNVVGAMDASKFGFEDFAGAVAQGGGVAASAGLSFTDFAAAVAATSTQFSSGSDAGTSFKTYIQSLVPVSDEAERAMKALGIEFFDLKTGRMKPLAEQAEVLRKAFDGLSDKSRNKSLKTIFGSDAARTAIALMDQGRAGIEKTQATLAGGDVEAKIAKRLEGEAAATTRLANAWESLRISIGEAGLLDIMTSIKNSMAGLLESMAHASPAMLKVGVAFGALAAVIGPITLALGGLAAIIVAHVARGFGLLGTAISFIIEPLSTAAIVVTRLMMQFGLMKGLQAVAGYFLRLAGPVGIAISALLLMKDTIVPALGAVWTMAQSTLGPPLQALFVQLGGLFTSIVQGPIGTAIGAIGGLFAGLVDVAATVVGALVQLFGATLVAGLQMALRVISGVVAVVQEVVNVVSALLTGDFAGAWDAATSAVDEACKTVIDLIAMLVPDITVPLKLVYDAAKAWLVDGFAAIGDAFASIVTGAVSAVAAAFPGVVSAAKGVYEGVKGWLVDKFGGLMAWVASAAKWIGDKYAALKERLGFGGSQAANDNAPVPAAPKIAAPAPSASGTREVDFEKPKKERKKKGRNTQFDGANREQLALAAELDAARERGDKEAAKRIQDRLDLERQVEAYQRTGLTLEQARVAANRDMALIQSARATAVAREIADERAQVELDVAQLGNNRALEDSLARQAELKQRVAFYYEQVKNLAEATRLAEADQAKVDAARARVREQWFADDAQDRALRLAQARGESEERLRQLQREIDIRERARDLERQGMDAGAAQAQASSEWSEEDKARMTGTFRQTFKDGVRSALDGDFGNWFQNFWKDRVARGMEDALNSLADLIADLFRQSGQASGSGGGGFLAGLGNAIGGLFGKKSGIGAINTTTWGEAGAIPLALDTSSLPRFNTGGSFKVGGMSGIDRNVVSMRLSKGEMVDIRKPGSERRAQPAVVQLNVGPGQMFEPTVRGISGDVSVQTTRTVGKANAMRARQTVR